MNENTPIRLPQIKEGYSRADKAEDARGIPHGNKDFSKVLDKRDNQKEGNPEQMGIKKNLEEETLVASAGETIKEQTSPLLSPFDLARGAKTKALPADPLGALPVLSAKDSKPIPQTAVPLEVERPVAWETAPRTPKVEVAIPEIPKAIFVAPEVLLVPEEKKERFSSLFAQEQPDLAYVNPMAPVAPAEISPVATDPKIARPVMSITEMQALVNQLADEMSIVKQGDKTETIIVLKHPPLLQNARITITQYEGSKAEFNLKFENLPTQAAQFALEQNRADLMTNLERRGYNVHIFITTTYDETRPLTAQTESPTRERQGHREQDEGEQEERRGR